MYKTNTRPTSLRVYNSSSPYTNYLLDFSLSIIYTYVVMCTILCTIYCS